MKSTTDEPSKKLDKNGVVTIENYLEPERCDEIQSAISQAIDSGKIPVFDESTQQFTELVQDGDAVVKRRTGKNDNGMLDDWIECVVTEIRE